MASASAIARRMVYTLCLSLCAQCRCGGATANRPAKTTDPSLLLLIREYPGLGPENESHFGPVCAVWRNGRVIRRDSGTARGARYVEGVLSADQMNQLTVLIRSDKLKKASKDPSVVIDAPSERLYIWSEGTALLIAESTPAPNAGKISVIPSVRDLLLSFTLSNAHSLEQLPELPN
jgi:hypothetical protein